MGNVPCTDGIMSSEYLTVTERALSADEIFEVAEQIERNGTVFYRNAASQVRDEALREMLEKLAADEDEHLRVFSAMRARLAGAGLPVLAEGNAEKHAEAVAYLRAMADGLIYNRQNEPQATLGENPQADTVMSLALESERDSIAFYTGIQGMMENSSERDAVGQIIREEMVHVIKLNDRLSAYLNKQ